MSSSWYPYIAPKIREVCKKHGVKYAYYPWIHQNFISTVTYMNQAGTGMHWETNPLSGNMKMTAIIKTTDTIHTDKHSLIYRYNNLDE
jgi:hypothetical protein